MPWEITIAASEDQSKPLGERDDVIKRVSQALPGAVLERPPVPPPQMLAQMPEVIRESFLRPNLEAAFEAEDFSIQFYTSDLPILHWIIAEVRGNGNPVPALAELCVRNGWLVIDCSDKSVVDLSASSSPEWERFRKWRDRAFASAKRGAAGES